MKPKHFLKNLLVTLLLFVSPCFASVDFDGSDDLLIDTSPSGGPTDGDLTVGCWSYPETVPAAGNGAHMITYSFRNDNTFGNHEGWGMFIDDSTARWGFVAFGVKGYNSTTTPVVANEWQFFAAIYDDTSFDVDLYHYRPSTGVLSSETVTHTASMNAGSGSEDLIIGAIECRPADGCSFSEHWDGQIGECFFYNKKLTAAQLALIYNSRVKGVERQIESSNLRGLFLLDDEEDGSSADGDTFLDLSQNNSNSLSGDNGSNNTGLTAKSSEFLTYP